MEQREYNNLTYYVLGSSQRTIYGVQNLQLTMFSIFTQIDTIIQHAFERVGTNLEKRRVGTK